MDEKYDACVYKSVRVMDPQRVGEGMQSYVSYSVQSQRIVNGDIVEDNVARRFKDFHWLHSQLKHAHKSCIIPPIPQKTVIARFTSRHSSRRQIAFHKFLNRLIVHRRLRNSEQLFQFLTLSQPDFKELRKSSVDDKTEENDYDRQRRKSKSESIMSYFPSYLTSMIPGTKSTEGVYQPNEQDLFCQNSMEMLEGLIKHVESATTSSHSLVSKTKEFARSWTELGSSAATFDFSELKSVKPQLGDQLVLFGKSCDRTEVLFTEKVSNDKTFLLDPFRDLLALSIAAKKMLQNREKLLDRYINILADDKSDLPNIKEIQYQTKKELDRFTDEAILELKWFDREKYAILESIIREFAKVQLELARKQQNVWKDLLSQLDQK